MNICLIYVFSIFIGFSYCKYESNVKPIIFNGSQALSTEDFPYQVAVFIDSDSQLCGGAIINGWHILTAGHCVKEANPENLYVGFGGTEKNNLKNLTVETITVHQDYDDKSKSRFYSAYPVNDIAILKLHENILLLSHAQIIPRSDKYPRKNTECTVSGWGSTYKGNEANVLMYAKISITDHKSCKKQYQAIGIDIDDSMLCGSSGNQDACQGDSGGPLVCNGKIEGIVSFGGECAQKDIPGVYTRVSYFEKWIAQTAGASCLNISLLLVLFALLLKI